MKPWRKPRPTSPPPPIEKAREDLEAAQRELEAARSQRDDARRIRDRLFGHIKDNHFAANTFALNPKDNR